MWKSWKLKVPVLYTTWKRQYFRVTMCNFPKYIDKTTSKWCVNRLKQFWCIKSSMRSKELTDVATASLGFLAFIKAFSSFVNSFWGPTFTRIDNKNLRKSFPCLQKSYKYSNSKGGSYFSKLTMTSCNIQNLKLLSIVKW